MHKKLSTQNSYPEKLVHKKVGIWGFGVTGQSLLRYLCHLPCTITVFEQKELSRDLINTIGEHGAHIWHNTDPTEFLEGHDIVVPSPGVNLNLYHAYLHKIVTEVDLFQAACTAKTIAITGSVGKTSITHLLGQLIQAANIPVKVGGNIGIGLLDLLSEQSEYCVVELSSFQLEYSTQYAPDIAVITNIYPNHLDRHQTIERYFAAKFSMVMRQRENQRALLPLHTIKLCNTITTQSVRYFFSWSTPAQEYVDLLYPADGLFFVDNSTIVLQKNGSTKKIISIDMIPPLSLPENWLILFSILYLMEIPLTLVAESKHNLTLPENRLEKVATINEVIFYNDSKSTTNQSTMAAVQALQGKPIHLFLGGLSKGVDRQPLIDYLKNRIVHAYCFGKEAKELFALCTALAIPCSLESTLEKSFDLCIQNIRPQDQVLFSPGGTSYDLFKDYEERGKIFKQMVHHYGTIQHSKKNF